MTFINDSGWCLFFVSHDVCGHWKVAFKINDYFKRWFQSRSFTVGSLISANSGTRIELQVKRWPLWNKTSKEKKSCRFWYSHDSHLITLWRWSVLFTKDSQMTLFFFFLLKCWFASMSSWRSAAWHRSCTSRSHIKNTSVWPYFSSYKWKMRLISIVMQF